MRVALLIAFLFVFVPVLFAAETTFDPDKARAAAQISDPGEATRAYLDSVPADRRAKTKSYAHGKYVIEIGEFLFSSAVLILLLTTGLSVRFRNVAQRITRLRPLQTALYWVQFIVVVTLISFPLDYYISFLREKSYGLLTQNFPDWLLDQAKGLLIGCILGAVMLSILYGVLRRAQRTWWIWGSVVAIVFLIVTIVISPVFISPIFNKFTPVQNKTIRDNVLQMAHRHGIPADEVYEMDASKRTDRISAYVSGMLGTMRIVMFDNTLKRCTPEEIQMIMGHEMAHYVLNHVWKLVGLFSVLVVLGFLFVRWAFAEVLQRCRDCPLRAFPILLDFRCCGLP